MKPMNKKWLLIIPLILAIAGTLFAVFNGDDADSGSAEFRAVAADYDNEVIEFESGTYVSLALVSSKKQKAIDVGLDNTRGIKMDFVKKTSTDKVLEFEIGNETSAQDINLMLSESSLQLPKNGKLTIRNITTEQIEKFKEVCNPFEITDPINFSVWIEDNCTRIHDGYIHNYVVQWLEVNIKRSETGGTDRLETFGIPGKGTYRYTFKTPTKKTESGYGSYGTIYLGMGDNLFVDKQQSSDFNESFTYRKAVEINNSGSEQLIDGYTLNFTMDTATLISEGKLGSGCDGLEFQYDGTVVERMFINDTFLGEDRGCDSTVSNLLIRLPENMSAATFNDTALFGYYGNTTPVELPLNNGSNMFLHYMESDFGNATADYDQRDFDYPSNSVPAFEIQLNISTAGLLIFYTCVETPCAVANENTTLSFAHGANNQGWKTGGDVWKKQDTDSTASGMSKFNAIVGGLDGEYYYWVNNVRKTDWDAVNINASIANPAMKSFTARKIGSFVTLNLFMQRYVQVPPTITLGAEEGPKVPEIYGLNCSNGTAWKTSFDFGEVITECQVVAIDANIDSIYVNFSMYNGTTAQFENLKNATNTSGGLFMYDFTDVTVNSFTTWNVTALVYDGTTTNQTNITWSVTNPLSAINVTLVSSSSLNYSNGSLTGSYDFNTTDSDFPTEESNETRWYTNDALNSSFANLTYIDSGNVSKGEVWIFSARVYNGGIWSDWTNSTALTIRNFVPITPTQKYPADNAINFTTPVTLNCTDSIDVDSEDTLNYEFYVNLSNTSGFSLMQNSTATAYDFQPTDNTTYFWGCRANDESNTSGFTANWTFNVTIPVAYPVINLSPVAAYNTTDLNCSFAPISLISPGDTATAYINFTVNGNHVSEYTATGVADEGSASWVLLHGNYSRGDIVGCNISLMSDTYEYHTINSTSTTILNSAPATPTQNYPTDNAINFTTPVTLNCSSTDIDTSDTINYEFYVNLSNTSGFSLMQNSTSTAYVFSPTDNTTYFWGCRANDEQNTSNYTLNRTFTINTRQIYNNAHSYVNVTVGEVNDWGFIVDFNNGTVSNITASVLYNGTAETVSTSLTGHNYTFNSTVTAPILSVTGVVEFVLNLSVTTTRNELIEWKYTYNQTVTAINMSECASNSRNIILNFTLIHEKNLTNLTGDLVADLIIWDSPDPDTTNILEINEITNKGTFYICMEPANISRQTNAHVSYESSGFDRRDYFLRNVTVDSSTSVNNSLTIPLYLLTTTEGTGTRLVLTDDTEAPLTDHYIYIQRKDISNSSFFTISMGHTDVNGEAYAPLEWYDAWHRFVVYDSEYALVKQTDETIIQSSPIFIRVAPTSVKDILDEFDDISVSLTFDNSTYTWTLTYSGSGGDVKNLCLDVTKIDAVSANNTICRECTASAAGTLVCVVGNIEGVFSAVVYAEQNPSDILIVRFWENIQDLGDKLGLDGVFYLIMLAMTAIFMFIYSPVAGVLATMLVTIAVGFFGIASIPYVAVVSLVAAGVIVIATMKS